MKRSYFKYLITKLIGWLFQEIQMVCLANSRKNSGHCIVGKVIKRDGFGGWIRPVSIRPSREISDQEIGSISQSIKMLDIVAVPIYKQNKTSNQPENYFISGRAWKKIGTLDLDQIDKLLDKADGDLWINGNSTRHGLNDTFPLNSLHDKIETSLFFIKPELHYLEVMTEKNTERNNLRRVRAEFTHNNMGYRLVITDNIVEKRFLQMPDGKYPNNSKEIYFTISLVYFEGTDSFYKVVAGIIGL
jgi:hypothetical protein